MKEESFGPIIGIQKVSGDEEAVRLMNDTRYGLTAGVYTPDGERAQAVLARVNAGSVYWNCCDRVSPRLPWSGVRRLGRRPDPVDLRHPDLHPAQGVAPAQPVKPFRGCSDGW